MKLEYMGGKKWATLSGLTVDVCGERIVVPEHFVTDLASVPQWLWWIFPPFGRYLRAALVHDYVYERRMFSKSVCDRMFLTLMVSDGVPAWKAVLFYRMVVLFGKGVYCED